MNQKQMKTENFWIGPYDVRIPESINSIKAADGKNTLYKNGSQTELPIYYFPTKDEYLSTYAEYRSDLHYWYKDPNSCCTGPCGGPFERS